jgi:inner membrane transporter RhtA
MLDAMTARLRGRETAGLVAITGSALSNQIGAATGALAFGVIGPLGVVAVRQYVAAVALLAIGRPRPWRMTWAQWWPCLTLGLVFGVMNLSLYTSISRIGLGLAVTLEFLGPLAVAIGSSRRRIDVGYAAAAGVGVVVLTDPKPTTDYLGIGLALLAAACWASYILLNRLIGQRLPGAQGPAVGACASALMFLPIGVAWFAYHPPTRMAMLCALGAGVLASAVPYLADLFAIRRIPTHRYGVLVSINPVLAAVVGTVVLHQTLGVRAWVGIGCIVAANVAVVSTRPALQTPSRVRRWRGEGEACPSIASCQERSDIDAGRAAPIAATSV